MNRETSIHSSDTLVVVDRSRRRRMIVIAAAVAVALLAIAFMFMGGSSETQAPQPGSGTGQVPTVSVVVPGRSDVARTITASGPLAARRDQPIGDWRTRNLITQ